MKTEFMSYENLRSLRMRHAAWRLLRADQAPFIASFLYAQFIEPHRRGIAEEELIDRLGDALFSGAVQETGEMRGRSPSEYLEIWSDNDHGWLMKYEHHGEWYYDMTAAAQKAVEWLQGLQHQEFVGTESRLRMVYALLSEIARDTDPDAEHRRNYLLEQRQAIDQELAELEATGEVQPQLDAVQLKERFLQAESMGTAILADFREVEENFRALTRQVCEDIISWTRGKGELLEKIFGESDIIRRSEQGQSFQAFWGFLMSQERQAEFDELLSAIESRESLTQVAKEHPLDGMVSEWVRGAAAIQQVRGQLSARIRHYVDEDYLNEQRTIYTLIGQVERHAQELREVTEGRCVAASMLPIDDPAIHVQLPFERRLFQPKKRIRVKSPALEAAEAGTSATGLAAMAGQLARYVDPQRLQANIKDMLQEKPVVTLAEVIAAHPVEQGLAEILQYMSLAARAGEQAFQGDEPVPLPYEREGRQMTVICESVQYRREDFKK